MTATVEPDMATDITQLRGIIVAEMVYWKLELFAFSPLWSWLWLKPGVQFLQLYFLKTFPSTFLLAMGSKIKLYEDIRLSETSANVVKT